MKTAAVLAVAASVLISSLFVSCVKAPQDHRVIAEEKINEVAEDIKEAIVEANEEAKRRTTADWQKFKTESEYEITVMESQTQEFAQGLSKTEKKENITLRSRLDKVEGDLETQKEKLKQRGMQFQNDMNEFDDSVKTKSDLFQREFRIDMDVLDKSLKNLLADNTTN